MREAGDVFWGIYDLQPDELKSKSLDMANYAKILMNRLAKRMHGNSAELESRIEYIHKAMLYYDIGIAMVPSHITVRDRLSGSGELERMRRHPRTGADFFTRHIAKSGVDCDELKDFIRIAQDTILCHHERWDGRGYPSGLSGYAIPICARICAIADSYAGMTSERAYRAAKSHREAYAAIVRESGKRFDPFLIHVFRKCEDDFSLYLEKSKQEVKAGAVLIGGKTG